MFLVSKKKYNELKEQYRELKKNQQEKLHAYLLDYNAYARMQERVLELQKEKQSMNGEIAHWKQLYADEVQKRIEMAELMKNQ